jgi:hypothetical protein
VWSHRLALVLEHLVQRCPCCDQEPLGGLPCGARGAGTLHRVGGRPQELADDGVVAPVLLVFAIFPVLGTTGQAAGGSQLFRQDEGAVQVAPGRDGGPACADGEVLADLPS